MPHNRNSLGDNFTRGQFELQSSRDTYVIGYTANENDITKLRAVIIVAGCQLGNPTQVLKKNWRTRPFSIPGSKRGESWLAGLLLVSAAMPRRAAKEIRWRRKAVDCGSWVTTNRPCIITFICQPHWYFIAIIFIITINYLYCSFFQINALYMPSIILVFCIAFVCFIFS